MEKHATIFLYTDDAQLGDDVRALLIEHGYLPIKVANMDAVKMIEAVPAFGRIDAVAKAAFRAINTSSYDSPRTLFGKEMARVLGREDDKP